MTPDPTYDDMTPPARCLRCNGSGTLGGSRCDECGQRRYDDKTCPDCGGTGAVNP